MVLGTNLSAGTGQQLTFAGIPITSTQSITITMSGGTGDADLYVRKGSYPTTSTYTCSPYLDGNDEYCTIIGYTGTVYVMIDAASAFSGVRLEYTKA